MLECIANVDEVLGEIFLEEKTPTEADIMVSLVFMIYTLSWHAWQGMLVVCLKYTLPHLE